MPNPYASPSADPAKGGVYAEHAQLASSAFLYREIEFAIPYPLLLVYSGWWFWQRVTVCDERVWSQISWLNLRREIEFTLPPQSPSIPASPSIPVQGRIEIDFGRALRIRRFRVWIGGEMLYDEIN